MRHARESRLLHLEFSFNCAHHNRYLIHVRLDIFMNFMQTCNSVTFYFKKNPFSDVSRKWILPNMIRVGTALIILGKIHFLLILENGVFHEILHDRITNLHGTCVVYILLHRGVQNKSVFTALLLSILGGGFEIYNLHPGYIYTLL